jgi:hypothetical protein
MFYKSFQFIDLLYRFIETNQVCLDSSSRGSQRSSFSRRDAEINLLIGALNYAYLNNDGALRYSQTCVQQPPFGPKIVAVVDRWLLFRGELCNKISKWNLKLLVVSSGLTL